MKNINSGNIYGDPPHATSRPGSGDGVLNTSEKDPAVALKGRAPGLFPSGTKSFIRVGRSLESVSKWHLQSSLKLTKQMGKLRPWEGQDVVQGLIAGEQITSTNTYGALKKYF